MKNEFYKHSLTTLCHCLYDNIILIIIGLLYFLTTYAIEIFLNTKIIGHIGFYYSFILNLVVLFFLTLGCINLVFKINKYGLPETLSQTKQAVSFSKNFFNFVIIYLLFPIFFCSYSSIKQAMPHFFNFNFKHDFSLSKIDYLLHLNNHPWELLQPIFGHPKITLILDSLYIYWGVIFFFTVMYMASHHNLTLRRRFFITLCLSWIFIGNILAALFFSAGPCYFSEVSGPENNPYSELFMYLNSIPDLNAINIQEQLWSSFTKNIFMPLGGISAMPSMHVAIATLLALLYMQLNNFYGIIMIIYAVLIQIGSVHLGWHYAIDGYVSSIATIFLWKSFPLFKSRLSVTKYCNQKYVSPLKVTMHELPR